MTTEPTSTETKQRCWICAASETSPWKKRGLDRELRPEDLQITDHRYGVTLSLRKCAHCGFIFADDTELAELTALYEKLDDPDYETTQDTRLLQMQWLLAKIRRQSPQARTLLDIGAGAGLLVAEARRGGLEAIGVEPSRALVKAAPKVNGVEILQGIFPHPALVGRKFDLITVVDVIEHVAKPVELLRHCREALAPDGLLVVVTPDVGSVLAKMLGPRWWHFRLAHVGYFNHASLRRAAESAGLEQLHWFRAKWFFRVRYLAERTGEYLPVGWINRLANKVSPLNWIYDRVVPLNLHDSLVLLLAADPSKQRQP